MLPSRNWFDKDLDILDKVYATGGRSIARDLFIKLNRGPEREMQNACRRRSSADATGRWANHRYPGADPGCYRDARRAGSPRAFVARARPLFEELARHGSSRGVADVAKRTRSQNYARAAESSALRDPAAAETLVQRGTLVDGFASILRSRRQTIWPCLLPDAK